MSSHGYTSNVQWHTGLTYIFNFRHSGTLALRIERQSARMSEIKNGRLGLDGREREKVYFPQYNKIFAGLNDSNKTKWRVAGKAEGPS